MLYDILAVDVFFLFFFQAEDGIRDADVTGVQTCALPISRLENRAGEFIECFLVLRVGLDPTRTRLRLTRGFQQIPGDAFPRCRAPFAIWQIVDATTGARRGPERNEHLIEQILGVGVGSQTSLDGLSMARVQ